MKTNDEVHLQARVCAVKCYYESKRVMLAAMQAFQEQWNDMHLAHHISDVRSFIQSSIRKLETTYTLHDAGGQGRPRKVADGDAVK
jgi:hypothetical protein